MITEDYSTFFQRAQEELDSTKPKQTVTGVSLVTAPHIYLALVELTMTNGRSLSLTVDTATSLFQSMWSTPISEGVDREK